MSDEAKKPDPDGLESVGGVSWPSDRAVEERRNLERIREFVKRYGTPEGVAELEGRVQAAQVSLDEWNSSNPVAREYLDAVDIWKRGWNPILTKDIEEARKAELKMRELEKSFGIQSSDIEFVHYPADELREKGYNDEQIKILHALDEGRKLKFALEAHKTDVNRIKSLLSRG